MGWLVGCHLVLPLGGGKDPVLPSDADARATDGPVGEHTSLGDGPPPALACSKVLQTDVPGALRGVWGTPPVQAVLAVGDSGRIVRYDLDTKGVVELGSAGTGILTLEDVWWTSLDDVRMVGHDHVNNRRYLHYDEGTGLTPITLSDGTDPGSMRGIAGNAAGTCYLAGTARRFFYTDKPFALVKDVLPSATVVDLNAVAVTTDGLAVAVGDGGTVSVVSYNSGTWTLHMQRETSTYGDLKDVWLVEAPGVIHLVVASRASKLLVLKLDRSNWSLEPEAELVAAPLNGVFGAGKRVYAVGDKGTILACDIPGGDKQLRCDIVPSGTTEDLFAIWARGTAAPNLFVVGDSGTFLHCRPS